MKLVIARSPADIKSLLFQMVEQKQTWEMFLKTAEEAAWMAFPNKDRIAHADNTIAQFQTQRRGNANLYNQNRAFNYRQARNQRKTRLHCSYHGPCSHTTAQCMVLAQMNEKRQSQSKPTKINQINQEDEPSNEKSENKVTLNYSSIRELSNKNPFLIEFILKYPLVGLLDTGADRSLINIAELPENTIITPYSAVVKAVNSTLLNISGIASNLTITINNRKYNWSPLVTTDVITNPIFGSDFIIENSEVLNFAIKEKSSSPKIIQQICTLQHSKDDEIKLKHADLFKTEI